MEHMSATVAATGLLRSAKDGQIYPYELSNLSKKDQVFIALLESKARMNSSGQITVQIFKRGAGEDEAPTGKTSP